MYTALDSKDLDSEFRQAYSSRPSRSSRKEQESLLSQERSQFLIESEAKKNGNVEVPFRGIEEGERRVRSREEMGREAKWLGGFFGEENRVGYEEEERIEEGQS